jgi:hypothetical protein
VFKAVSRTAGVLFRVIGELMIPLAIADILASDSIKEAAGKAGRLALGIAGFKAGAALCAPGGPLAAGACAIVGGLAGSFAPEVIEPIDPKKLMRQLQDQAGAAGQH